MTFTSTLVLSTVVVLCALILHNRQRTYYLMALSAMVVYALQPNLPIPYLDFWLPTITLLLATIGWIFTTPREKRSWKKDAPAILILGTIVLVLGLSRYFGFPTPLTASRPPQIIQIIIALGVSGGILSTFWAFSRSGKSILIISFIFILVIFVILKFPALTGLTSAALRELTHRSTDLASALDIRWLGFSYIAFRILHTIRDRQNDRLPAVSLSEYITYIIFFPTLTAGPIDRIERFVSDLRRPLVLTSVDWLSAGKRLAVGLFKKFAIADALALIALNGTNALQVRTSFWMWVLVYAYSIQIYFDFSGYTDIAIGLGRLLGFNLPENFNAPYIKPNLTQFWNNWHMTLTQWFRAYFFNPITRALRSRKKPLPMAVIIFITQLATMILIGIWHGITWNFIIWGLWHGLGLFCHNRWSEWTRVRYSALAPAKQKILNIGGILLTFNFVALGWVFFTLPDLSTSWHVFLKLFGVI